MATFDPAPPRVAQVVQSVIDHYYPDLTEAKARIDSVFAYPAVNDEGEIKGPAMKKNGRQVLARVKKRSEEDRASGTADATITFDAPHWQNLDNEPDGQRALVDHELYHLEVVREKPLPGKTVGPIKTDDKGRPVFKIRLHDWELTGFRVVAERHGKHSYEVQEAREWRDAYGNLLFDFADDLAVEEQSELPGLESEPTPPPKSRKSRKAEPVGGLA